MVAGSFDGLNWRLEPGLFSQDHAPLILARAVFVGAFVTAINRVSQYDAMTDQLAATLTAARCQSPQRALKTVKHMGIPT